MVRFPQKVKMLVTVPVMTELLQRLRFTVDLPLTVFAYYLTVKVTKGD